MLGARCRLTLPSAWGACSLGSDCVAPAWKLTICRYMYIQMSEADPRPLQSRRAQIYGDDTVAAFRLEADIKFGIVNQIVKFVLPFIPSAPPHFLDARPEGFRFSHQVTCARVQAR